MNVIRAIRGTSSTRARLTLVAASVAWFAFLLQPCVMAASPTATVGGDSGVELSIVTHHGPGISAEKCLHCDDNSDLLPDVCDENAASGSYSSPKPFDNGTDHCNPAAPALTSLDSVGIASGPIALPQAEDLPPPVALTEAYCVYLE
jgi:hypothetical protein